MKKVLFVMNTLGRAGAEMALLELLRQMSKQEMEISLYVLTGQGEMKEQLPEGVRLLNKSYNCSSVHTAQGRRGLIKTVLKAMLIRGNLIRLMPYMLKETMRMIKAGRILPDKILWRLLAEGAERFDEEYDLAVAYIEGGSTYYVADHVKAKKKAAFFHVDYKEAGYTRSLDRDCYAHFDKVFTISEDVRTSFLQEYPEYEAKVELFHNLIPKDRILKMAQQQGGFTDDYDGYRILTVGRLMAQKDFAQSIQAMRLLKEQGIKARWYILGEGEQRAELTRLIEQLQLQEDFYLLGVTDNPYAYMAQADIYVHATRFEGKSIAIQEAQILGCAILVSDCNGNRDQVTHGVDGMLCELNPQSICEGIQTLLADEALRQRYGQKATLRYQAREKELDKLYALTE